MRKSLIIITLATLLLSCATYKPNDEYISVYKTERYGDMLRSYLILKVTGEYDVYGIIEGGGIGSYTVSNDTLTLIPKYEYTKDSVWLVSPSTYPKYLIRGSELINIPSYDIDDDEDDDGYRPTWVRVDLRFPKGR